MSECLCFLFQGLEQRLQVTSTILRHERLSTDVDLDHIAKLTEGFSGSDIRELCRMAAVYGMRDSINTTADDPRLEEIAMQHFLQAFQKMRDSKRHCGTLPMSRIDLD